MKKIFEYKYNHHLKVTLDIIDIMAEAAALRAERRRQRILQNSENRMTKIFGGENYHDGHLTMESPNESTSHVDQMQEAQPVQSHPNMFQGESLGLSNSNTADDENFQQLQSLLLGQTNVNQQPSQNHAKLESSAKNSLLIWIFIAIACRIMLASAYSWICMDNAFLTFTLVFILMESVFPNRERPSEILNIIATLTGIDSRKITSLATTYSMIRRYINYFCVFFITFIFSEMLMNYII